MHLSLETSEVYFLGDIHGEISPIQRWNHICSNSILIQVGDYCVHPRFTEYLADLLQKKNNKLIVVRGNHERFIFNDEVYNDTIFLLKDYSTAYINGLLYQFIGGAISIDRIFRLREQDRYPGTEIFYSSNEPVKYIPEFINPDANILITHTCPRSLIPNLNPSFLKRFTNVDPKLERDLQIENEAILKVFDNYVQYGKLQQIYCGHYHQSIKSSYKGISFRCLDINEITN